MSKEYCLIAICPICQSSLEIGARGATNAIPIQFGSIEDAMKARKAYESGSGFLSAYGLQTKKEIPLPDYIECSECGVVTNRTALPFFVRRFPQPT